MALKDFISTEGYKEDSPDRHRPYNIIPSDQITMSRVPHPVYGIDNLGNTQMMMPGGEYTFGGDYVLEIPMQAGGQAYQDSLTVHNYGESNIKKLKETQYMDEWNDYLGPGLPFNVFQAINRLEDLNQAPYDPVDTYKKPLHVANDPINMEEAGAYRWPKPVGSRRKGQNIAKIPARGMSTNPFIPGIDTTPREGVPPLPEPTIVGYTQQWDKANNKWLQEPVYRTIDQRAYGGDIQTGGGYNYNEIQSLKKGGIYIKPSKRGTFTSAAKKRGMGVQEFASKVLANKGSYSPAMVKKANFARNAAKWKKQDGGYVDMELDVSDVAELRRYGFRVEEL